MPRQCNVVKGVEHKIRDIVFAVIGLAIAIGIYAVFEGTNIIPVKRRGFFCDDPTIRYPFVKRSTFPSTVVLLVFVLIPTVFIAILEFFYFRNPWTFFYTWIHFWLAFCFSGVTTDSLKVFVGRLRPYFIEICKPDVLINNACHHPHYVTNYTCLGGSTEAELLQARKSWPSGHSQASICCAVFVSFYAWRRLPSFQPHAGRQIIVFLILFFGLCVSISRVVDHRHHVEDVLSGGLIGAGFAVYSGFAWWHSMNTFDDAIKAQKFDEAVRLHGEL